MLVLSLTLDYFRIITVLRNRKVELMYFIIVTQFKMKLLSMSVRLDPLNYSTNFNIVFSNGENDLKEKFTYVIHKHGTHYHRMSFPHILIFKRSVKKHVTRPPKCESPC